MLPKKGIELSTRDEAFVNDIIEIMEESISDSNFGIEELSAKMNLSASHFLPASKTTYRANSQCIFTKF